jgi:predicted TIM-barrel fold metal-dependent hydrolase
VEGARIGNDALAELCHQHADRFVGLAALPLPDVEAAICELDRALDQLDFRGVFLPSHLNGIGLDNPSLEAFYAHAAQRGVPLVLHPSVPTWGAVMRDHSMIPMMGFMVDTSIAMLKLILGGVLERHPTLQVVHPHAGGVLPYVMGRVVEQTEVKGRGREQITRSPRVYYQQVYLDLVSPDPLALDFALHTAGAERLLFGSDHPWVGIETMLNYVRTCNWPHETVEKALYRNAARLFRIAA